MRSPSVGRWQLAGELRRLRGNRSANEVARALRMTVPTVHRWEMPGVEGMVPSPGTLSRLLEYYGVSEAETERIMAIRSQAKGRGWWQAYDLDQYYSTLIGLESEATDIFWHESILIPGLLQTEEYIRAIVWGADTNITEAVVEEQVHVRKQRQETWLKPDGASLWAIIGEASLRQLVGGSHVLRSQLAHLLEMSEHPRLRLQVLPFSAGAHAGMTAAAFQILELAEVGLRAVYVESRDSRLYLDDNDEIQKYSDTFDQLKMSALGITATRQLILKIKDSI